MSLSPENEGADKVKDDIDEEQRNPKLSFESEEFDPHLVLFAAADVNIHLPVPEAKAFNNLAEYYQKTFPNKNPANKKLASTEPTLPLKRNLPMPEPVPRKELPNVLTKMVDAQHGPLSILYRSINRTVRVLIRRKRACPIRSEQFAWTIGLLVAFDKHLNLSLGNAIEQYQHHHKGIAINIRKNMKSVFIRGDNVILVTPWT